ncbi:MAG: glycoside hydrolase family 57 protein [Bacteroidales bacterium]|nr:glycoside hydrolase family 57 protein [Bacteroidales bacterium]
MKTICFYFQVHQPYRLKNYRFFEIGYDHYYYDDFSNRNIMKKVAEKSYLPMNKLLLELIKDYGSQFKVSFSISGVAIKQFEEYAPEVLESFKKLAATGSVEFLAETYSHSLSALTNEKEFKHQVELHNKLVQQHFGIAPKIFRNTELIYSDEIGRIVSDMGYNGILTEGARHILGWKSPNFVYYNAINPKLKVLLKNYKLSDDIAFRFSNKRWDGWPLTADKYVNWLNQIPDNEEVVNLFMDYETFGEHQWADTGIFEFMRALPNAVFKNSKYKFLTPSEVLKKYQPVAAVNVPNPISWADEERDLTAWLGNEMQDEAFDTLYKISDLVGKVKDANIQNDWLQLQTSDHFYYMCTKFFSDGDVHTYFNPYENPYNAFINYMNILSDFILRVEQSLKTAFDDNEPQNEAEAIQLIEKYQKEIERLKLKAEKFSEKPSQNKDEAKKNTKKKASTNKKETIKKPKTTKTLTKKKKD